MSPKRESLRFCVKCPAEITEEESRKWNHLCKKCAVDALVGFKYFLHSLQPNELGLLAECFDGVGLDEPEKARLPE